MCDHSEENILILTKTYPIPSRSYRETVCVVGITQDCRLLRLYPIQYRFLAGDKQFKKWQWIQARISKSSDRRPESYNIDNDTIRLGSIVTTEFGWSKRISCIQGAIYSSFHALEQSRVEEGISLGFIKPNFVELEIVNAKEPEWTHRQLESLTKEGLFDLNKDGSKKIVSKLPVDFYYRFNDSETNESIRLKINDWEAGALYWNCKKKYKEQWEMAFRNKLEQEFNKKNLHLLLGTNHRFQYQWLIVGLIYPPHDSFQPTLLTDIANHQ